MKIHFIQQDELLLFDEWNICTIRNYRDKRIFLNRLQFGKKPAIGVIVNFLKILNLKNIIGLISQMKFEGLMFVKKRKNIPGPCQSVARKFKKDAISKRIGRLGK